MMNTSDSNSADQVKVNYRLATAPISRNWSLPGMPLRIKALKALGDLGDPAVLPRLDHYFRSPLFTMVSLEERRAAFRSLSLYPPEARRPYVERGRGTRDPEIRRVCERLAREPPPVEREGDA